MGDGWIGLRLEARHHGHVAEQEVTQAPFRQDAGRRQLREISEDRPCIALRQNQQRPLLADALELSQLSDRAQALEQDQAYIDSACM